MEKVDETWGKRRLAYAINYRTEGWYVLVTMQAPAELVAEVERNLRINDSILRYMTVKLLVKQSKVKPRAIKPVAEEAAAPAEEAAPAAEAPVEPAEAE